MRSVTPQLSGYIFRSTCDQENSLNQWANVALGQYGGEPITPRVSACVGVHPITALLRGHLNITLRRRIRRVGGRWGWDTLGTHFSRKLHSDWRIGVKVRIQNPLRDAAPIGLVSSGFHRASGYTVGVDRRNAHTAGTCDRYRENPLIHAISS